MKVKKVNRYYCDFCKKAGCSAAHMKRHEERCTANPNRICGMCVLTGRVQVKIADVISTLPAEPKGDFVFSKAQKEWEERVIQLIDDAVDDCPVCKFAVLRQAGISLFDISFDFQEELRADMERHNKEQQRISLNSVYGIY